MNKEMQISIDESAGFCWGVVRTIDIVENSLEAGKSENIYVLGQIIHNPRETERLEEMGLKTITHKDFEAIAIQKPKVIIRAHGEPPETFSKAKALGIEIIDATCPLVTRLQDRLEEKYLAGWQIVIFGKEKHAEVIGLQGVCNGEAIVVSSAEETLEKVNFNKKTILFSQTTMDKPTFDSIKKTLEKKAIEFINGSGIDTAFLAKNTICKSVSGREETLKQFCIDNDVVIFVAGRNSSNGKSLYNLCLSVNDKVYFVEKTDEINSDWFNGINKIGITGATSTPQWYMRLVKDELEKEIIRE